MKKNLSLIFSILLIVFAIAISAIVFFVPKGRKNTIAPIGKETIKIIANDLEIVKGQKHENFYSVSNKNAVVSFEIEKEDLVQIDGDDITALKQGETNIKIIAKALEEEISCVIRVKISSDKFATISAKANCRISDNRVITESFICSIKVSFFDNYGNPATGNYLITNLDSSAVVTKRAGEIFIQTDHSFEFNIEFENGELSLTIQVVFN